MNRKHIKPPSPPSSASPEVFHVEQCLKPEEQQILTAEISYSASGPGSHPSQGASHPSLSDLLIKAMRDSALSLIQPSSELASSVEGPTPPGAASS